MSQEMDVVRRHDEAKMSFFVVRKYNATNYNMISSSRTFVLGLLMRRLAVSICLCGKIFTSDGWYVVAGKTSRV